MKMTSTEMVEHLRAIAEEFSLLANEQQSIAQQYKLQAEKYYKSEYIAKGDDCNKKDKYFSIKAKSSTQSAKNAIALAEKLCANDEEVMNKLQKIETLIQQSNVRYSLEACKSLKILIWRFFLQKQEPYSIHLRRCGELYDPTKKS